MSDAEENVPKTVEEDDKKADEENVNDSTNGQDDEEVEPIGSYAVIPEDPPIVLGPMNALEKKIIKQVEYYFSDINLTRDRFLQDQIKEDPDGWVSIAILTKFNRLKALTSNLKMIATALRKSENGLLEVSKDGVYTRRSPTKPLPDNTEDLRSDIVNRTAYAKGFPLNSSLDKLIAYFEKEHGSVETVFMRRNPDRKFKGSVYVTFEKQSDTDTFLQKESIQYDSTDLIRMTKEKHSDQSEEKRKEKRLERIQKKKEDQLKKEEEERQKVIDTMTKAAVLHANGLPDDTDRDVIKNFFNDFQTVAWVEYEPGKTEAHIRFDEENKATLALQSAKDAGDGDIKFKEQVLECNVLEGDEEIKYWTRFFRESAERQRNSKKRKSGGGDRDRDRHRHRDKRSRNDY